MKSYPSIPASIGQTFRELENCYVFDKLDGNNIRIEYSKKQGWYKFGTRTRLFDHTDAIFGPVIPLFKATLEDPLTKIAKNNRWEQLIVFAEYHGPNSFAGMHDPEDKDKMLLTVFDANPYKQGILGPKDFLNIFGGKVSTPSLLTIGKWTRGLVERIRNNYLAGITFEGVVGKSGSGHELKMTKAKTQNWIDKVKARYSLEEAEKLINS